MGAIRDFLESVGRTKTPYTGVAIPGPPPADTASAEDKAKFDESVRKYQLDRRAYEQYNTELNNRLRNFNPYADPQYRVASTTPPSGATSVSVPTPAAPTPPTQLRAPTYGAISQFSNLTPQQQGELYLQQRNIGYTDEDIRKATAAQVGTPSEEMMANIYKTAYPQYTQAIESQYGSQFNRSGYGTGANQIDYPGFNYYINQLSTGAVTPDTLESAIRGGAGTTTTPGATPGTTPGTTAPTTPASDINAMYQQYFNRQADPAGLQYWQQSGLTGDALKNAIIGGAQGNDLYYYNTNFTNIPTNNPNVDHSGATPGMNAARGGYINRYAHGGEVRTHYQSGGRSEMPGDNLSELEEFYVQELANNPRRPMASRLFSPPMEMPVRGPVNVSAMTANIGEGGTPQPTPRREDNLAALEDYYRNLASSSTPAGQASASAVAASPRSLQQGSMYGAELREARARAAAESEAFSNMLQNMMNSPESQQASRAEMYFRLASAFGAPTRTGHMGETLSNVGQQMGEYTRGQRASEADRRKLMLEGQKLRMETSRADLNALRNLAQEELRDQRALQTALIQAGRPQSRYGQAAIDLGMTPGTPEFIQYVRERSQQDVENADELARSRALTADLSRRLQEQRSNELSNQEVNLRIETENSIAGAQQALLDIRDAYRFNENSFEGGLLDRATRLFLENTNPRSPIVVNTNRLENLLGQQGLEKLKATFGGQPTEGERRILLELEGIGSKTIEERRQIIQRTYSIIQQRIEREQKRLDDILSGRIRQRTTNQPPGGQ